MCLRVEVLQGSIEMADTLMVRQQEQGRGGYHFRQ
jgi:hypothetical protein